MNLLKTLSVALVIAIAAATLYPTISDALPESWDRAPYSIGIDEGGIGTEIDEDAMTFRVTIPAIRFSSGLPETIHDVRVEFLLGSGDSMISAGVFDIGDVPPNETVSKTFVSSDVPLLFAIAYSADLSDGDGLNLPILMKTEIKYLDWKDTQLIDIGMTMKTTGTESSGSVDVRSIGVGSAVTVVATDGLVADLIHGIGGSVGSMRFSGSGISIVTTAMGDVMNTNVLGSDGMTGYEILKRMVDETGKISLECNGIPIVIEGDAAIATANAMAGFYREASA